MRIALRLFLLVLGIGTDLYGSINLYWQYKFVKQASIRRSCLTLSYLCLFLVYACFLVWFCLIYVFVQVGSVANKGYHLSLFFGIAFSCCCITSDNDLLLACNLTWKLKSFACNICSSKNILSFLPLCQSVRTLTIAWLLTMADPYKLAWGYRGMPSTSPLWCSLHVCQCTIMMLKSP